MKPDSETLYSYMIKAEDRWLRTGTKADHAKYVRAQERFQNAKQAEKGVR